ncbi:MAG: PepSY domain-containing protein [bacterium]
MKTRFSTSPLVGVLVTGMVAALVNVLTVVGTTAQADSRDRRAEQGVSKREAARIVKDRYGGKVLDVRPRRDRDNGYRVKILDGGRVKVFGVDGRTGEIRR